MWKRQGALPDKGGVPGNHENNGEDEDGDGDGDGDETTTTTNHDHDQRPTKNNDEDEGEDEGENEKIANNARLQTMRDCESNKQTAKTTINEAYTGAKRSLPLLSRCCATLRTSWKGRPWCNDKGCFSTNDSVSKDGPAQHLQSVGIFQ